jgi:hypothetical protein
MLPKLFLVCTCMGRSCKGAQARWLGHVPELTCPSYTIPMLACYSLGILCPLLATAASWRNVNVESYIPNCKDSQPFLYGASQAHSSPAHMHLWQDESMQHNITYLPILPAMPPSNPIRYRRTQHAKVRSAIRTGSIPSETSARPIPGDDPPWIFHAVTVACKTAFNRRTSEHCETRSI